MPAVPADLLISCRWILPMTSRDALLEHHSLVVRDGRIFDVLPSTLAAERYAATVHVERPQHLLLPGLVNARTQIVPPLAPAGRGDRISDCALLGIAALLRGGTSCFAALGFFPADCARLATAQGMRALIGIPLAEFATPWAKQPGDYLTRALHLRDELAGHPLLATAFAPHGTAAISDALFSRIATLANELDAGVLVSLHTSAAEVTECVQRHGERPLARLHALGLLTPALTAADMVHVDDADMALAQRSGIAITLCPESNFRAGVGPPPARKWAESGLGLSLGSGAAPADAAADLWSSLKLLALLAVRSGSGPAGSGDVSSGPGLDAWDVLAAATRGGAAALGLGAEIGTLETGKWADLCCVDLRGPAMVQAAASTLSGLVSAGGRDLVTDVWVAGRHLLNEGTFTRLDWPAVAARVGAWNSRPMTGVGS
jgi:5-methylthioadenosine/S-adenosylhomocysteine deaminase